MDKTARPQVELPDNRSTLLSGDLDVFASQYPKTADRIRAELNRLATRLAESEARAEGLLAWLHRIRNDVTWRTNDNALWRDILAAIDAAQEAKREAASA